MKESCHAQALRTQLVKLARRPGCVCAWVCVCAYVCMYHVLQSVTSPLTESCHIYEGVMSRSESCHIWMSHVTHEWAMSHTDFKHTTRDVGKSLKSHDTSRNESWHIWTSHVTEWVMAHMNESCHGMSHGTYEWVMSRNESWHIWRSHVTEWVVAHMNESCHEMSHDTYERVMSRDESWHIWTSHVTERVISRMKWIMSHTDFEDMGRDFGKALALWSSKACRRYKSKFSKVSSTVTWHCKVSSLCVCVCVCVFCFPPFFYWVRSLWKSQRCFKEFLCL